MTTTNPPNATIGFGRKKTGFEQSDIATMFLSSIEVFASKSHNSKANVLNENKVKIKKRVANEKV